jgi:hypothetical protein
LHRENSGLLSLFDHAQRFNDTGYAGSTAFGGLRL